MTMLTLTLAIGAFGLGYSLALYRRYGLDWPNRDIFKAMVIMVAMFASLVVAIAR